MLWCSGLKIQLQQLRSLQSPGFNPWLLGQWIKDTSVARIQPLAQELLYAVDVAIKKKKKKKKKKNMHPAPGLMSAILCPTFFPAVLNSMEEALC